MMQLPDSTIAGAPVSMSAGDIFTDTPKESLPFSTVRQEAVIGHALLNERFFLQAITRIDPSWFHEPLSQTVWTTIKLFHTEHKQRPSKEDVYEHPNIQQETQQRKGQLQTKINTCIAHAATYSLEALVSEMTDWLKSRIYQEGVYKSRDLYNRKQCKESYAALDKTALDLKDATFESEVTYDFEDLDEILEKREQNVEGALTWGLEQFDRLLLPEGKGGSLLPATTTTLIGPVNAGKTTVMMTVGCANLKAGKKVLYIPHEGHETELRAKWLCCMLNVNLAWLNGWRPFLKKKDLTSDQAKVVAFIKQGQAWLKNLTFMPMIKQGLEVERVFEAIRRKNDEVATRDRDGVGFHLVIDDYPAKLSTEQARGGKLETRHRIEWIYAGMNRLAEEIGYHHLNGAQVNREGNKINKGFKGYEKRLLEMEDFNEAFGPMADTATVITLNRDPIAEAQDRVTMHCAKSRTSSKGWSVVCRSRYGNSVSHSETMGCTWYKGSALGTERLNQLIDTFRNTQIPYDEEL